MMESRSEKKWDLYDLVMLVYLIGGLICLPMIIGEALVESGWVNSTYQNELPRWLIRFVSGYEILLLFGAGAAALVAWIPALILCIIFPRSWRVLAPSGLLVVTCACLFFLSGSTRLTAITIFGVACPVASFSIGLEWFARRLFQ